MGPRSTLLLYLALMASALDFGSSQVTDAQAFNVQAFINEVHYQDRYGLGEFVEVAIVDAFFTDKVGGLALYDGSSRATYKNVSVAEATAFTDGSVSYLVWDIAGILDTARGSANPNNGIALHDISGAVIEFISYGGGNITAVDGVAKGMTSKDIGIGQPEEGSSKNSMQRIGSANAMYDGMWILAPRTKGGVNVLQTSGKCTAVNNTNVVRLNEILYNNRSTDSGEFVEFVFQADSGISAQTIGGLIIYDGTTGLGTIAYGVANATFYDDNKNTSIGYIVWDIDLIDERAGVALVDNCNSVLQFVSYGGSFMAKDGLANGQWSTDIGYTEDGPEGESFQRQNCLIGSLESVWVAANNTRGKHNTGQDVRACLGIPPTAPKPAAPSVPPPTVSPVVSPSLSPNKTPQVAPTKPTAKPATVTAKPSTAKPSTAKPPTSPQVPLTSPPSRESPTLMQAALPAPTSVVIPTSKPSSYNIIVRVSDDGAPVTFTPPMDDVDMVSVVVAPSHGTAVVNKDKSVSFVPNGGVSDTDTFSAKFCTGAGFCAVESYTVIVRSTKEPSALAALAAIPVVILALIFAAICVWKKLKKLRATKVETDDRQLTPEPSVSDDDVNVLRYGNRENSPRVNARNARNAPGSRRVDVVATDDADPDANPRDDGFAAAAAPEDLSMANSDDDEFENVPGACSPENDDDEEAAWPPERLLLRTPSCHERAHLEHC